MHKSLSWSDALASVAVWVTVGALAFVLLLLIALIGLVIYERISMRRWKKETTSSQNNGRLM